MGDSGKGDPKKKIRTEGGQVIANKKSKKNLYPFVQKPLLLALTDSVLCAVTVLCRLTASQLRAVEEEIQN